MLNVKQTTILIMNIYIMKKITLNLKEKGMNLRKGGGALPQVRVRYFEK